MQWEKKHTIKTHSIISGKIFGQLALLSAEGEEGEAFGFFFFTIVILLQDKIGN